VDSGLNDNKKKKKLSYNHSYTYLQPWCRPSRCEKNWQGGSGGGGVY